MAGADARTVWGWYLVESSDAATVVAGAPGEGEHTSQNHPGKRRDTPCAKKAGWLGTCPLRRRFRPGNLRSSVSTLMPLSRRSFLSVLGLSGVCVATGHAASSDGGAPAAHEVLRQRGDEGSCGPCAVGNALLRGDPAGRRAFGALPGSTSDARLEALVTRYGRRPSEAYGRTRMRFEPGQGITNDDLVHLTNDLLADAGLPGVRGQWLDRQGEEAGTAHVRRIHGMLRASLARGLPAVVEIRGYAADAASAREPWTNLAAHWLALSSLDPELASEALGFGCRFADSSSGREIPAFVSAEIFRPFNATRGFRLKSDGAKEWLWVTGRPYLLLTIPDLPMYANTRANSARTLVALTYLLSR